MSQHPHPPVEFAFPGPLRDRLVGAILDGRKTTTTGLWREYEQEGAAPDRPGQRQLVLDSRGRGVAVIELVEVRVLPLAEVDLRHAVDEGEGHRTVAAWRADHERFWQGDQMRRALGDPDFTVDDSTLVVAERFRLVERL
ncbi:ASCH domain-containing protein [Streptomyces sp. NPDC005438]|uniref:ASCH domain-containing protein n=1 Tax=Streptomyces sp. NPDC005438 TaxID=3156880 RepID=UPI0033BBA1D0